MKNPLSNEEIEYALLLQNIYTSSKGDHYWITDLENNHLTQAIKKTRILLYEKEYIKKVPRLRLVMLLNEKNKRREQNADNFSVERS